MMSQKQNELLIEWLEHCIATEADGNEVVKQCADALEELIEKLNKLLTQETYITTKTLYRSLISEAEELLAEYLDILNGYRKSNIENIVNKETQWLQKFGKKINKNYKVPATVANTVLFFPIVNKKDYAAFTDNEISKLKDYFDSSLRLAYVTKQDTKETKERFTKKTENLERNFETDDRTINTAASRATAYAILKANNQKVVYSSILDTHTCLSCAFYSGKIFDITKAPGLPLHENCRCSLIPIEVVDNSTVNNFSDFLEELSDEDKKAVLGKSRFQLYEKGVKVTSFVNNGEIKPVKQLREEYPDY